ncbi:MAG: type III pantothenate kinase [Bacteroidales bacterium]|jgi:type III pantothenate kinase|nr:type III pantothenate kinase [Bacteroidales bacterium]
MKLIIDKGNTRTKIAIYKNEELLSVVAVNSLNITFLSELLTKYKVKSAIFSSVSGTASKEVMSYLEEKTQLYIMSEDLMLPIEINYLPKYSLGNDRIAAIVGGYNKFPKKSVLIIDAGSCITMDFINSEGIYKGGSISLGFQMKSKALNTFTARLPLVEVDFNEVSVCSNNTIDCIKSGIINGTLSEISGMIERYLQEEEREFEIVLTGGDAELISKRINKNFIVERNLVLQGLNMILDYNIKNRNA